jgi:hypothetical protein
MSKTLNLQGLRTAATDSREAAKDFKACGLLVAAAEAEAFGAQAEALLGEAEMPTREEVLVEIAAVRAKLDAETDPTRLKYLTEDLGFFTDLLEEL